MKKLCGVKILLLVLISLFVLSACSQTEKIKYDNKEADLASIENMDISDNYDEKINLEFLGGFSTNSGTTSYGRAWFKSGVNEIEMKFSILNLMKSNIYFDEDISIEDRKEISEDLASVLDYMADRYNNGEKIDLYISDKIESCVKNNKTFIKYSEDYELEEIVSQILLAIYGEYSNYGLIYGEAIDVLEKTGKVNDNQTDVVKIGDFKNNLQENPEYLDLIYPLFAEEYRDDEDIDISVAKGLALDFSKYMKNELGQEYLDFLDESSDFNIAFDEKFVEYMNAYLKANDVDLIMNIHDTAIRSCKTGNFMYRINISSEYVNYKFQDNFYFHFDAGKYIVYKEGNTYAEVINYVHEQEQNLSKIISFWDEDIDESHKHTDVYFTNDMKFKYFGMNARSPIIDYDNPNERKSIVIIKSAKSFSHEMTHRLYDEYLRCELGHALVEGRAILSDVLIMTDNTEYFYDLYKLGVNYPSLFGRNDKFRESFDEYMKSLGQFPFDNKIFEDEEYIRNYMEICAYKSVNWEKIDRKSIIYTYNFGAILSAYIIDNYGLDSYKEVYKNSSSLSEFCDNKSIYSLEKDIYEYLHDKYDN